MPWPPAELHQAELLVPASELSGFYSLITSYGPDAVLDVHSSEQRGVVLPLRSSHSSGGRCQKAIPI